MIAGDRASARLTHCASRRSPWPVIDDRLVDGRAPLVPALCSCFAESGERSSMRTAPETDALIVCGEIDSAPSGRFQYRSIDGTRPGIRGIADPRRRAACSTCLPAGERVRPAFMDPNHPSFGSFGCSATKNRLTRSLQPRCPGQGRRDLRLPDRYGRHCRSWRQFAGRLPPGKFCWQNTD